jgi:transcriptional regulator with XRE-family HTH domain
MKMKLKIKEARERANLTQTELASRIGVAPNTFCGYENGLHDPKSGLLIKISKECNTSIDFLLGMTDDPRSLDDKETKKSPAPEGAKDSEVIKRERSYRLFDALVSAGLIRNDDLVADDINFLFHVLDVVDDWFARKERK